MKNNNIMTKHVRCLICGKKGTVKIQEKDGKILSKNFYYFGTININYFKTEKYFYEVLFDKNNKPLKDKNNMIKTKKVINPNYDSTAKKKEIDYWECSNCYNGIKYLLEQ
ncbi:MAG: hypothetical protein QXL51_06960 [Candidatus Aenigmatarchaeota archaeon]